VRGAAYEEFVWGGRWIGGLGVRYVVSTGAMGKVHVLSVQKLAGKREYGRPRRWSGYSIKMDLMKTGTEVVNEIKVV